MRTRLVWRILLALALLGTLFSSTLGLGVASAADVTAVVGDPNTLQPGDILFMRNYRDAWSSMSYWTHNAIYIGAYPGCTHAVVEAISRGVSVNCLDDRTSHWFYRKDFSRGVGSVKRTDLAGAAVKYAVSKIGKPYDFFLSRSSDTAFYCSELIWKGYWNNALNNFAGVNIEYYAGRYISPDDEFYDGDVLIEAKGCVYDGTTKAKTCPTAPKGRY